MKLNDAGIGRVENKTFRNHLYIYIFHKKTNFLLWHVLKWMMNLELSIKLSPNGSNMDSMIIHKLMRENVLDTMHCLCARGS
jgi:hypothetical protein